jgi:hypothetical protein
MAKNREQLTEDITQQLNYIQTTIDDLTVTSATLQTEISRMVWDQVQRFEIKNTRFIAAQDPRARLLDIEERMEKILRGKIYTNAVKDYLGSFSQIEAQTVALHRDYNDLEVELKKLSPARQVVYNQAKDALYSSGINAAYKGPVMHMLLFQVTTGGSISDMEKILERWTTGDLSASSRSPTGKPIPNLQQYTTQLARDTSHQYAGTLNEIIRDEYGLEGMHYVGDIITDSRPLCVYLVNLRRDVPNKELQQLLDRPDLKPGRIPGTTVENFCTYRGGYGCRHLAFPVRVTRAPNEEPRPTPRRGKLNQAAIDALRAKNVRFYVRGRQNDEKAIQIIGNRFKNFDPVALIDQMDKIGEEYGVTWRDRSFELVEDPEQNGTAMKFLNSGTFKGKEITMNRRFYMKDGRLQGVYHSLFTVPGELQGKNFAKELFSALLDEYKAMGLREITVTANIDVGGYAWAQYGFEALDKTDVLQAFGKLKRKVDGAGGKYVFTDNKGGKTTINAKEIARIQEIISAHYEKYPDAPFPMNQLSRRKSGKALLLGTYWSGVLDLTKKRKLRIFEDYLKKR